MELEPGDAPIDVCAGVQCLFRRRGPHREAGALCVLLVSSW